MIQSIFVVARKKMGISQQKMADLLGVSQASIAQYELGNRFPNRATARRFLDLAQDHGLQYSFDDLVKQVRQP